LDKSDLNNYEYTATVRISKAEGEKILQESIKFFQDNTEGLPLINLPVKEEMEKTGRMIQQKDQYGLITEVEEKVATGFYLLRAKSKVSFGDKVNVIPVLRANKQRLKNFNKEISPESTGRLYYKMGINSYRETAGVLFFLTGLQFAKFIEGVGAIDAEEIEIEDDGLGDGLDDGWDNLTEDTPISTPQGLQPPTPDIDADGDAIPF